MSIAVIQSVTNVRFCVKLKWENLFFLLNKGLSDVTQLSLSPSLQLTRLLLAFPDDGPI